jgi:hypothetical protein
LTKKTFHVDGRKGSDHQMSYHLSPEIANHEPHEMLLPIIHVMPIEMNVAVATPLMGFLFA